MSTDWVKTRREGVCHVVTLSRADKRNALTMEFTEDIAAAIREADHDSGIRAVVVEGEGPIFSAGIDVMSLAQQRMSIGDGNPSRWLRRFAERLQHALHTIELTEVPVIGAIQGKCLGMGLELALAFDFRIVEAGAKLALPETRLGLIADVGGTTRLTKLIGPSRTKDMLMTAREVEAEEALAWGMANRIAAPGQAFAEAVALAEQIARNAPLAVGLSKFVIDQGDGVDRYTQMAIERLAQGYLIGTEDIGEAMAAFMEKRPAKWKGA
ncbi:MAG: enoyl-CoA hydratase [Candidatus Hydrogenedens sp.]|nr:enoyl-CoA hydratase [Candidatus Hydrogenedens sp.]